MTTSLAVELAYGLAVVGLLLALRLSLPMFIGGLLVCGVVFRLTAPWFGWAP